MNAEKCKLTQLFIVTLTEKNPPGKNHESGSLYEGDEIYESGEV
jgi:hypothetical protein